MIDSPCVNICRVEGDVCVGCWRTLNEIARWSLADDKEKLAINAAAKVRQGGETSPAFSRP